MTIKPSDKGATGGASPDLNASPTIDDSANDDSANEEAKGALQLDSYTVATIRVVGATLVGIHQAVVNGHPVTVVDYAPKYQVLRTVVITVGDIKTPLRFDWQDISAEQAREYFNKGVPVPDMVKFLKDNKKTGRWSITQSLTPRLRPTPRHRRTPQH